MAREAHTPTCRVQHGEVTPASHNRKDRAIEQRGQRRLLRASRDERRDSHSYGRGRPTITRRGVRYVVVRKTH
ncbi:hypothetical protein A0H81_05389 [Grifola frondosa]|uniref:Uncharacterized protein n=1 Tax=Grifola frondosa TaxID=5627 RepID=A0A1C7MDD7_GRIFR|nr:hypothetical protein A0H81_05389 [Grifola frondosa]